MTYFKSQYERMANILPLRPFANHTVSTAEMGGNYWAAQVAGKMFARATHYDKLCEWAGWQNEECNVVASEAWETYRTFMDTFKQVNDLPTKRLVAIGNRDGVTAHDLPYTDADMGRFGGGL